MRSSIYPIVGLAAFATSAAAQACTVPPYYNNPAYGPQSGCVPTGYLSAADLGNTNPTDAATRCSQQCSRLSNCGGWVAQLNKSPNGLYSGSCFFYTTLPASPQSCADKPTELVAGVRDDTPKCFSASKSAATAFCSSFLGIGQKTVTAFAPTPTVTATATTTNTVPSTSTSLTTQTDTVTSTVTTTTQVTTSVTTQTQITTTTVPAPVIQPVTKRAVAPPACVPSGIPASQLSANCQCLSITSATVTTTVTPAAATTTATITATATTLIVEQKTSLTTVTVPATATEQTTTVTTTTTTTIVQETMTAFGCTPQYVGNTGYVGFAHNCGISASCFCIPTKEDPGTCTNGNQGCGPACTSSAQCAQDRKCLVGLSVCGGPNDGHCELVNDPVCRNPNIAARRLFRKMVSAVAPGIGEVVERSDETFIRYINGEYGLDTTA